MVNEGMQAQATGAEQINHALVQLGDASSQTVESLRQASFAIDELNRLLDGRTSDDFDELDAALRTGTQITLVDGDADAFVVELPRDTDYVEAIIASRQA